MLVKRLEPPTKSIGGILLPESASSKLNEGVVLAAGPGRRNVEGEMVPMELKVDDKVLLPQYGGNEVTRLARSISSRPTDTGGNF